MNITLKRSGAIGDIITTFIVAEKLVSIGYEVTLIVSEQYKEVGLLSPYITNVYHTNEYEGRIDIDYDGVYEYVNINNTLTRKDAEPKYWINKTNNFLKKHNKKIDYKIQKPELKIYKDKVIEKTKYLENFKKPWYIFVHGSYSDITRKIPIHIMEKTAENLPGTSFILDYDKTNIPKLPINNVLDITTFIYLCDTIITPVTGPLHIANGYNKKIITLSQSNNVNLLFPDNNMKILKDLIYCVGCASWNKCKRTDIIKQIPCQQIEYKEILKNIK